MCILLSQKQFFTSLFRLARKGFQSSDVLITLQGTSSMSCRSLSVGLLPSAFPISIYQGFSQDVDAQDYLKRLKHIGAPQEYINWLESLPANAKNCPKPTYLASPSCVPPAVLPNPDPPISGPGPVVTPYDFPSNKLCVFVTDDLIFEKAMKKVASSAMLIGGAMLEVSWNSSSSEVLERVDPSNGLDAGSGGHDWHAYIAISRYSDIVMYLGWWVA